MIRATEGPSKRLRTRSPGSHTSASGAEQIEGNIEKALRESEERLRLAIEAARVGAWDWDVVNDRITWSEQIYEFYGVRRGEFDGRIATFQRFVHPEDWERVGKLIQRSLSKLE